MTPLMPTTPPPTHPTHPPHAPPTPVPYADLINHSPFSTAYINAQTGEKIAGGLFGQEDDTVVVFADRPFKKMEQFFISYGQKSNAELLLLYGFSLDRNPFNSVEISVGLLGQFDVTPLGPSPTLALPALPTPEPHVSPDASPEASPAGPDHPHQTHQPQRRTRSTVRSMRSCRRRAAATSRARALSSRFTTTATRTSCSNAFECW